jgi:hypothetical protein
MYNNLWKKLYCVVCQISSWNLLYKVVRLISPCYTSSPSAVLKTFAMYPCKWKQHHAQRSNTSGETEAGEKGDVDRTAILSNVTSLMKFFFSKYLTLIPSSLLLLTCVMHWKFILCTCSSWYPSSKKLIFAHVILMAKDRSWCQKLVEWWLTIKRKFLLRNLPPSLPFPWVWNQTQVGPTYFQMWPNVARITNFFPFNFSLQFQLRFCFNMEARGIVLCFIPCNQIV